MNTEVQDIDYDSLKNMLQDKIRNIDITDIQRLTLKFNKETEYVPQKYKKEYNEKTLKTILQRYNKLKNDTQNYNKSFTKNEMKQVNKLLKEADDNIEELIDITAIYATLYLKEPIHPTNTILPGNLNIYKEDKIYYCPIKKNHINNKKALCQYCIAEIPEQR